MLLIKLFPGPVPHFCPGKRCFLILPAYLVLLLFRMDFDPFPSSLMQTLTFLLSDHSNAGYLFGTNVLWLT